MKRGRKLKLTDEQVLEIRADWRDYLNRLQEHRKHSYMPYRGLTHGILARRYDVSSVTIAKVLSHEGAYARKPHIRADKLKEYI